MDTSKLSTSPKLNVVCLSDSLRPRNEAVISLLESVLEEAKAGEICHVAIAAVNFDLSTSICISAGTRLVTLRGATAYLNHRIDNLLDSGR